MAFTKDELKQIGEVVVEVTAPMFEHVIENLGGRIDRLESEFTDLRTDFYNFKSYVQTRFAELEQKIDDLSLSAEQRLGNLQEDVDLLAKLVEHSKTSPDATERALAKLTAKQQVPVLHRAVQRLATELNVKL